MIGPSLSPGLNPSNQLFVDLFAGKYPGIMNLTWGFVDVRDVAEAHVRAMEAGGTMGRYICAGETVAMRDMVAFLRDLDASAGASLPKLGLDCGIGDFTVRLSSYLQPKGVGSYLRTHVGRVPRYDTSKIQKELGISFRPPALLRLLDRIVVDAGEARSVSLALRVAERLAEAVLEVAHHLGQEALHHVGRAPRDRLSARVEDGHLAGEQPALAARGRDRLLEAEAGMCSSCTTRRGAERGSCEGLWAAFIVIHRSRRPIHSRGGRSILVAPVPFS